MRPVLGRSNGFILVIGLFGVSFAALKAAPAKMKWEKRRTS
jgi:hypothetical protein